MDALAEIKRLYYAATKATIQRDLLRAIELLKTLPSEDERERVAVYMDGLSQMRSEWAQSERPATPRPASRRTDSTPSSSVPRAGAVPARSDRSKASLRRSR
jgi:hypothetical protein